MNSVSTAHVMVPRSLPNPPGLAPLLMHLSRQSDQAFYLRVTYLFSAI